MKTSGGFFVGYLKCRMDSMANIKALHDLLLKYYDEIEGFEKKINVIPMAPSARNSYIHVMDSLIRKRSETPIDRQDGIGVTFLPETNLVETIFGFFVNLCGRDESRFICDGYISNETSETLLMLKAAEYSDCFFDVGANLGYYSFLFATASNLELKCYAFEPVSDAFQRLTQALKANGLNGFIYPQKLAVGSEMGESRIKIHKQGSGGSSLSNTFLNINDDSGFFETVQTVTLDHFISHNKIEPNFGVLKIDVEGFENEVIDGAVKYLSSKRPPLILIETYKDAGPKGGNDKLALSKLVRFGYEVFCIREFWPNRSILYTARRFGRIRRSKNGNYIAFHRRHRELKKWCMQPTNDDFLISQHRLNSIIRFQKRSVESAKNYVAKLADMIQIDSYEKSDLVPIWEKIECGSTHQSKIEAVD